MDLDTSTDQSRGFHVSDVQHMAIDILDTHGVLVALGGTSLDSPCAPAGVPAAAPEAETSLPADLHLPSEEVDSSRPRGSKRPPPVR